MRKETVWQIRLPVDIPPDLLDYVGGDRVIAGYLVQRGITTIGEADCYLNPDRKNLTDPFDLPEMDRAVERLLQALTTNEKIGIWGDFDMDGQTATAVQMECLTKLNADVIYHLPVRGRETHGIAIPSLDVFLDKGVNLMVTCDTGISEIESVRHAASRGVDVIITDHHTLPEVLPEAVARINPRMVPEGHPLGSLSGSAAAFELMLALCRRLGCEGTAFESIDLAAIGLIADLAPLQKDSRLIAQLGLQLLNDRPRKFVAAIFAASDNRNNTIDEQTIGYTIAPRLNAAGRLEDANPFVKFLTGQLSDPEMKSMAEHLESMNANRKWLCDQVYQSAIGQIERQPQIAEDPVILVSHATWPGGVLGLAAGNLAKDFNRPAIVFRETPEGRISGSARSVEGINITEAITSSANLLTSFGGHPMAAGLSLKAENLPEFKRRIFQNVLGQGFDPTAPAIVDIDEELSLAQVTPEFHYSLRKLAPFGNSNPALLFCSRRVRVTGTKPLGRTREHFQFQLEDQQGHAMQAVWWSAIEADIPSGWFDLAYSLNINEYKGRITLQAVWADFHNVEEPEDEPAAVDTSRYIDFRSRPDPLAAALLASMEVDHLVYQEPYDLDDPVSCGRDQLHPVPILILSSVPPSWQVFGVILKTANPHQVFVAFDQIQEYSVNSFVKQLYARLRYAVDQRNGIVTRADLAQALNSRPETVEAGLNLLAAMGKIAIQNGDTQLMEISLQNSTPSKDETRRLEQILDALLTETRAFQRAVREYDLQTLTSSIVSLAKNPHR